MYRWPVQRILWRKLFSDCWLWCFRCWRLLILCTCSSNIVADCTYLSKYWIVTHPRYDVGKPLRWSEASKTDLCDCSRKQFYKLHKLQHIEAIIIIHRHKELLHQRSQTQLVNCAVDRPNSVSRCLAQFAKFGACSVIKLCILRLASLV